ncbi:MAG: haloacid dehalogenase-like hydrolase [Pseudomonadales bacterium]|nr:haloacid dehalogenase-like hydrolase [Pseudomonadales bacterium]
MKVLLVDVCFTLYKSNTTFDFFEQYFTDNVDYQKLKKLRRNLFVRVLSRIVPYDFVRENAVKLLLNHTALELKQAASLFVDTLEPIGEVKKAIAEYRSEGYTIVLLSSSLDFIVEAVSIAVKADHYYATTLVYENQICKGKIEHDLFANKDKIIKQEFVNDDIVFLSDNKSDLNCAPLVNKLVAVFKVNDKSAAAFWKRNHIEDVLPYE